MYSKLVSITTKHIKKNNHIELFLEQFNYIVINEPLETIRNLIYVILDVEKYPLNDQAPYNKTNKFKTTQGLNLVLSRDYKGKNRKLVKKKGFIKAIDYLKYYKKFHYINKNIQIHNEGNCYELCYLLKDFLDHTIKKYALRNINYELIFTNLKHSLLRIKINNIPYDFDPLKPKDDGCYFGPARLEMHTTKLIVAETEFEKFFDKLQEHILKFQKLYQETKVNWKDIFSPLRIYEKVLARIIDEELDYPIDFEDEEI